MRALLAAALIALAAFPGEVRAEQEAAAPDSAAAPDTMLAMGAAADTSRRVTGTPFRFGATVEMVQRHGSFPIAKTPGRPREVTRAGPGKWFGIDGELTLFFRAGRLQRVGFAGTDPSPRAQDYARDQLRSSGFRPVCEAPGGVGQTCVWHGRTAVRLEISAQTLNATIEPPAPPRRRVTPEVRAPEVFVIGRPGVTSRLPAPEALASPVPEYPSEARVARVQGNVWVRALVDTGGSVLRAEVTRGIPELDAAAVRNAMQWRFAPYRIGGAPARFEVEFPVRFVLR